jgi:hypothetical protein
MARKQEEWISSQQAAAILSESSGHIISSDYVRQLGRNGKLTTKQVDLRTKLYLKSDVEAYTVKKRGDGSVRREARAPRGKQEKPAA